MRSRRLFIVIFSIFLLVAILPSTTTFGIEIQNNSHSEPDHKLEFSKQAVQSSSVKWKADNGTLLTNGSYYLGPNKNVTIEWDQVPTKWNVTALHGDNQSIEMDMSFRSGIRGEFFLQRGDTYTIRADWNDSQSDLDLYIFDPNGKEVAGCNKFDLNSQKLCEPRPPPTVLTNFFAKETGNYKIKVICEETGTGECNLPLRVGLSVSNLREKLTKTDLTEKTFSFSTKTYVKGNLTILTSALINGSLVKNQITFYMDSQPPPLIKSFKIDGKVYTGTPITVKRTTNLTIEWDVENRNPSGFLLFFLWYWDTATKTWAVASYQSSTSSVITWDLSSAKFPEGEYQLKLDIDDQVNKLSYFANFTLVGEPFTSSTRPKTTPTSPGFEFPFFLLFFPLSAIIHQYQRKKRIK